MLRARSSAPDQPGDDRRGSPGERPRAALRPVSVGHRTTHAAAGSRPSRGGRHQVQVPPRESVSPERERRQLELRTRTVHGCVLTCAAALAVSAAGAPSGATATEPAHGSAGDRVVASSGSAVASRTVSAHSGSRRGGSGQVIWAGDAESPSSREWATGNAFDVNRGNATSMLSGGWSSSTRVRRVSSPVAQGSSAYAVTVLGGDRDAYTSGAQRTEVGQNNASRSFPDGVNRQMTHGQERWIALQLRIPADFPSARWNSLVQLKGAGTGNGPFGAPGRTAGSPWRNPSAGAMAAQTSTPSGRPRVQARATAGSSWRSTSSGRPARTASTSCSATSATARASTSSNRARTAGR